MAAASSKSQHMPRRVRAVLRVLPLNASPSMPAKASVPAGTQGLRRCGNGPDPLAAVAAVVDMVSVVEAGEPATFSMVGLKLHVTPVGRVPQEKFSVPV